MCSDEYDAYYERLTPDTLRELDILERARSNDQERSTEAIAARVRDANSYRREELGEASASTPRPQALSGESRPVEACSQDSQAYDSFFDALHYKVVDAAVRDAERRSLHAEGIDKTGASQDLLVSEAS